jgi:hypothetical protein
MTIKVKDIYWVNEIDPRKIILSESEIPGTKRKSLMYKYDPKKPPTELYIATPKIDEGHVIVRPVVQDEFKGVRTTNYKTNVTFNSKNSYHEITMTQFGVISDAVDHLMKTKCIIPSSSNGNDVVIYARLITSKDGIIYTPFYDTEGIIEDPTEIGGFSGRVCFGFSVDPKGKIFIQIMQAYAAKRVNMLPLIYRD